MFSSPKDLKLLEGATILCETFNYVSDNVVDWCDDAKKTIHSFEVSMLTLNLIPKTQFNVFLVRKDD